MSEYYDADENLGATRDSSGRLLVRVDAANSDAGSVRADDDGQSYAADGSTLLVITASEGLATGDDLSAVRETVELNAQTVDYELVLGDAGKKVRMNHASDRTITVPPNSTVAFAVGTVIELHRAGAGAVTVVEGSGVTINSVGDALDIAAQHTGASLHKVATNEWDLIGNLA